VIDSISARQLTAVLLSTAILWGGFRPELLHFVFTAGRYPREFGNPLGIDPHPLRLRADPLPVSYIEFLDSVNRQTRPGDSIALLITPLGNGFTYAFYRAAYSWVGRRVAPPVLDESYGQLPRIGNPQYLALWGVAAAPPPSYGLIWEGHGGSLWKRAR
jgi:hypothetical protein